MSYTKTIHPGGWIRTSALSQRWPADDWACEWCGRTTCGPWWLHFDRKAVRCNQCQTGEDLWKAYDAGLIGRMDDDRNAPGGS